jgi:hypothetical protein
MRPPGLKPVLILGVYAALKRRSSTVVLHAFVGLHAFVVLHAFLSFSATCEAVPSRSRV